jgi:Ca-activated chloride channel family protein
MIPDGSGQFVKDERGAVVLSKLESATLQELAQATGGVYRDASAWVDLAALVKETIDRGQKGDFLEKNTIRLAERYQWPLAFGLWCLLVSVCFEFPVRPRPRDIKLAAAPGAANPGKAAAPLATAALLALFLLAPSPASRAAASLAPAAAGAGPTKLPASAPAEPSALAKIVGRLATAENRTARDWAELGRETATWGSRLRSEKQPVPEGAVRDALAAADLGEKLDPKATDWPKLREELAALLKQPDEDKQEQQKQDKQDQKDQQQNKDQQKQDQKSDQQPQQDQNQQQQNSDQQDKSKPQDQKQEAKSDQKPSDESAFGDMNKKEEPPPPPQEMQKVGGAPEKKPQEAPEKADPNLALPLQKLDQLRQQDSPAQLFQLMEGDKKGPRKTGKDW